MTYKEIAEIFEIVMILSFGFSWPFNIMRAYKARTAKGTSLPFISLIGGGYVAGVVCKFVGSLDPAFVWHPTTILATVFYFINLTLITTALIIYFRNKKLDNQREQEQK